MYSYLCLDSKATVWVSPISRDASYNYLNKKEILHAAAAV